MDANVPSFIFSLYNYFISTAATQLLTLKGDIKPPAKLSREN
jgi:hypothetical protein